MFKISSGRLPSVSMPARFSSALASSTSRSILGNGRGESFFVSIANYALIALSMPALPARTLVAAQTDHFHVEARWSEGEGNRPLPTNKSASARRFVYCLCRARENVPLKTSAATSDHHAIASRGRAGRRDRGHGAGQRLRDDVSQAGGLLKLLAKTFPRKEDRRVTMTLASFLTAAYTLANDKARELGWII